MAMVRITSAPDALALAPWTQRIAYSTRATGRRFAAERIDIFDRDNQPVERPVVESGASSARIEKGNYRHYMQKEIFEQPIVVAQTLQSYVHPAVRRRSRFPPTSICRRSKG